MSKLLGSIMCAFALTLFAGCDVDVEDTGEMPDVSVDPGHSPDVDVHGPEVDVTSEEKTMTVPDVDVDTEEKQVDVPDVDISVPDENEN